MQQLLTVIIQDYLLFSGYHYKKYPTHHAEDQQQREQSSKLIHE
jgi:hypothetical protein